MSTTLAALTALCFGVQFLLVTRALPGLASDTDDRPVITAAALTLAGGAPILWLLVAIRNPPLPEPALLHPNALLLLLPFAIAGVADPAATRVLSYEGIERVGPTISAAILAASPAVAAITAILVLDETVTLGTGIGTLLVVVGVAALQIEHRGPAGADPDFLRRRLQAASPTDLLYPAAGAVLIGVAFVVVELGFQGYSNALVATATAQTAALAVLLPAATRRWLRRRRQGRTRAIGHPRAIALTLVAGVVLATGWFAMFLALQGGTVVTILPIVSTYPLVVAVGSAVLERELPRSPLLIVAVLAIVVGAALVQLA